MKTYALGAFELSQLRAFDDNVDTLYASADATRLHQIIRMAVQSSTLTEVDLYELRLLLPRILPQEQEDEEVAPASAASEKKRMTGMNGLSVNLSGIGSGAGCWKNSTSCCTCCRHSSTNIKKNIDRFCCITEVMDISADVVFSK